MLDIETGKEVWMTFDVNGNLIDDYAVFSPNGKILVNDKFPNSVILRNSKTGQELLTLRQDTDLEMYPRDITKFVSSTAFSIDSKILAVGNGDGNIRLWNVESGIQIKILEGHSKPDSNRSAIKINSVAFSPSGKLFASASDDNTIRLWNIERGKSVAILDEHTNLVTSVFFSPDSKILASGSSDGTIKLWNTENFNLLGTLVAFYDKGWLVVTPEGFFDGTPNAWKQLIWRFNNNTFDYGAVELYFNDFFYPNLLQEVLAGKSPKPKAGLELEKIDRRQPKVEISSINGKTKNEVNPQTVNQSVTDKRTASITVEVTDNIDKKKQPNHQATSGAQDLRLFRNGSLVKIWHDDVFDKRSGCESLQTERDKPRRVRCQTEIPIVAGENNFTAYAFNLSNVKSNDDTAKIEGKFAKKDGTLYILAFGVNDYAPIGKSRLDLNFAVPDVVDIGKAIEAEQIKIRADANLKQYAETRVITLKDETATKENILLALKRLTKDDAKTNPPENICAKLSEHICAELKTELSKIKPTEPEDALLIYFAGHGTSRGQRFYLLPHNFTGAGKNSLIEQGVSDIELNDYLEKVDAGKLLMTIDACQSGQALGAKDAGRAPMNSKGLAQLAYDKGMLILTATISQEAALEALRIGGKEIKHGLLTYFLLEGLKNPQAGKDSNKQLCDRDWFNYAVEQVPQMQTVLIQGCRDVGRDCTIVAGEESVKELSKRSTQVPRVFYRREADLQPLLLAKP